MRNGSAHSPRPDWAADSAFPASFKACAKSRADSPISFIFLMACTASAWGWVIFRASLARAERQELMPWLICASHDAVLKIKILGMPWAVSVNPLLVRVPGDNRPIHRRRLSPRSDGFLRCHPGTNNPFFSVDTMVEALYHCFRPFAQLSTKSTLKQQLGINNNHITTARGLTKNSHTFCVFTFVNHLYKNKHTTQYYTHQYVSHGDSSHCIFPPKSITQTEAG